MTPPSDLAAAERILIVEDEALIAEELRERLTRLGYGVVGVVETSEEAIRNAERERPDLVLMDIRLKGGDDGIAAAGEIRDRLNLPVVYLTAHSDRATLERAKVTAPHGYLLKPLHERELAVTVELALHRHRLTRGVEESALRYAATLSSLGDGVIATDVGGRITLLNSVAEALTGWSSADSEGLSVEDVLALVGEADRRAIESPVYRALREGRVVELLEPTLLITRQGEAIPIDDSAAPITTGDGKSLGAVVVFRDNRQRRLAADALHRAEEELARSRNLEAVGRLAAGVAHDFNSLLTVIGGYSEMLLGEGLDEGAAAMAREILNAAGRAAALTQQLLAFSGQQRLLSTRMDLNALVLGSLGLLRRLVGEAVVVTPALGPGSLQAFADPKQIERVLTHLATNARDAMPEGGRLTLETGVVELGAAAAAVRPEIKPGRYLTLAISDTGTGMDDGVLANLFQPFFTTKDIGKGTGLGLAAAYGIVKQSGGHLEVESAPGFGTTFRIFLPAATASPD